MHTPTPPALLTELTAMLSVPLSGPPSREAVDRMSSLLGALPQTDLKTRHYRIGNLYGRDITIPKGVALTGAVIKQPHVCVVSKGSVLVTTDTGPQVFEAGTTLECAGGTARVGVALEDTIWAGFFALPPEMLGASLHEIEAYLVESPELLQSNRLLEAH